MNDITKDYVKYQAKYYSVWPTVGRVLFIVNLLIVSYIAFHYVLQQNTTVQAQIRNIECVGVK